MSERCSEHRRPGLEFGYSRTAVLFSGVRRTVVREADKFVDYTAVLTNIMNISVIIGYRRKILKDTQPKCNPVKNAVDGIRRHCVLYNMQ